MSLRTVQVFLFTVCVGLITGCVHSALHYTECWRLWRTGHRSGWSSSVGWTPLLVFVWPVTFDRCLRQKWCTWCFISTRRGADPAHPSVWTRECSTPAAAWESKKQTFTIRHERHIHQRIALLIITFFFKISRCYKIHLVDLMKFTQSL